MPNRHSVRFLLFLFLLILGLGLVGCSDDDEDVVAAGATSSTGGDGDIFVSTDPSILTVPWVLTMPGGATTAGANDYRFQNQNNGAYTISWPKIDGWNEPRPSTVEQTLVTGSNLLFNAIYLPQPGTSMVMTVPEGLDAAWVMERSDNPWTLDSSDIFFLESSGDTIITNLIPGYYRTIWYDVEGFDTPDTMYTSLNALSPMVIVGAYGYADSTVLINPTPLDLDAPWTLTGVNGFTLSGNGQTKVEIPFAGDYTITWLDVEDRITPDAQTSFFNLEDGRSFYMSADYLNVGGSVNLVATINGAAMPWSFTNSEGGVVSGAGDYLFEGMPAGQCSVEWLAVDGWVPDLMAELELPVGGSITFTAAPEAAITVIPIPVELYASWQLTGPGGYTLDGQGEMLVDGLSAGSYTITWTATDGWGGPASSSLTLAADNGLVFEGTYVQVAQTLHINPLPASLDISWEVTGPLGFSQAGSGMASFPLSENGVYTVVWGEESGYMQPGPQMMEYTGEGNLNFQADYLQTLDLVNLTGGSFTMGSSGFEGNCRSGFEAEHPVTLTQDFIIKATEVTNAEYIALAQWAYDRGYITANVYGISDNLDGSTVELLDLDDGDQEIFFEDGVFRCIRPNHPVKEVSWYGAVSYCDWLSLYRGFERAYSHVTWLCGSTTPYQASGFRLPTEAEWEYACRAGSSSAYTNGGNCYSHSLGAVGWYDENGNSWSNEVGQLDANAWGLFDMHGNVMEWCNDWYYDNYYFFVLAYGPEDDPVGAIEGTERIARGGYFYSPSGDCRSAARTELLPSNASYNTGFRVVLTGN